jgi:hypothetical protein
MIPKNNLPNHGVIDTICFALFYGQQLALLNIREITHNIYDEE